MINPPEAKTSSNLVAALPALFVIHSLEEMCTIDWYVRTRLDPSAVPGFMRELVRLSALQLVPGTLASLIVLLAVCFFGYARRLQGLSGSLVVVATASIFSNAVFHILEAAVLRHYVPGLVASLLLCIPVTVVLFLNFVRVNMISYRCLAVMIGVMLLLQGPWALVVHTLGSFIG